MRVKLEEANALIASYAEADAYRAKEWNGNFCTLLFSATQTITVERFAHLDELTGQWWSEVSSPWS